MRLRTHIAITAGAALLGAAGIAAPALASGTADTTNGTVANGAAAFRSEAARDGLSAQQISGLQKRVDSFLATSGGTQIAANKIAVKGGSVTLTVPGEKYARALNSGLDGNSPATALGNCPYYDFCGYKGANYSGSQWNVASCSLHEIPDGWNSGGSWINNQSSGTRARMYNKSKALIYTTPGAYSFDPSGDWGPVWYVRPC
ncbi:hypothetical protein [Streptomyces formicae]|uniref:Secreted protein n=1 Tax=Streptomyces formicae TaxID=1616117 RepID=A0A291QJ38_9ACTN|nr:hypothetical protein [Streptomyces formicae]ATL31578.1 hypothetical protein KY5_6560 [Streptomyces formicae]